LKRTQRIDVFPPIEPGGEHDSDAIVLLGEPAEEVGDQATPFSAALLMERDEKVGPTDEPVPGVEAGEQVPRTDQDQRIDRLIDLSLSQEQVRS
jgi:hypothetical protein